jgi:hypothetical protein
VYTSGRRAIRLYDSLRVSLGFTVTAVRFFQVAKGEQNIRYFPESFQEDATEE